MSLDGFDKHYDKCLHEFGRKFKNTKRIKVIKLNDLFLFERRMHYEL